MQKYLAFLLGRFRKAEEPKPGCRIEKKLVVKRPRAYVIRIPGGFLGMSPKNCGGFQTVVMAENCNKAWDVAAETEEWEVLLFKVSTVMVFPSNPL